MRRPTPRSKRRRGLLTVVMVLVAVATVATARAATVISETTWGGVNSEVTNGAAVASDGSTYLAGFTNSFDPLDPLEDAFVVKFTPEDHSAGSGPSTGPRSSPLTGRTASPSRQTARSTRPARRSASGTTSCC